MGAAGFVINKQIIARLVRYFVPADIQELQPNLVKQLHPRPSGREIRHSGKTLRERRGGAKPLPNEKSRVEPISPKASFVPFMSRRQERRVRIQISRREVG